jgi:hypothetical protein
MTEALELLRNKTVAFIAISFILFFSSCRSLEIMNSQWLTVPSDSQGQMEDFAKNITCHLYENGLLAGVGNDEKYLYILFSPDIRHHARPPSRASLALWLDGGGSKTREYGFFYTRTYFPEDTDGTRPGNRKAPQETGNPQIPKPPAVSESLLQCIDKQNKKQTFLPPDGSQGPQIHFSSDWGDFVYAWRIPLLEEMKENFFAFAAKPGQAIGIGLLWEIKPLFDLKKTADRPGAGFGSGGDGPPDRGGGGMGGPPGGGMSRGGPGPGADFAELPASRKIWLKIILAHK